MPTTLPAMRGKFGSTEFFLVTMRAKELAERLVIPKELEGWEDMTLEERFQRDVSYDRVKKHIAPYLANDPDRFFGAFIVDIYNDEGVSFEPLDEIVKKLPGLYQHAANVFGFLYMQGNEVLVPLDGQHRLAAIRFAISGMDQRGKEITEFEPNIDVANDLCTVILVRHDKAKARKIFNKVNRYAKSTSKADNLITADDDIVAIITREEIVDKIIDERLVNYKTNTLVVKATEFTTLSVLYDATGLLLENRHGKIDRTILPGTAEMKLYRTEAYEFWQSLLEGVNIFSMATHDPNDVGDKQRQEIRSTYTLGKPIVQLALVDAIVRLMQPIDDATQLGMKEICERINETDWQVDNMLWQRVLMNSDKVVTGRQAARFAARFIAYLLGEQLHQKEVDVLEENYSDLFKADGGKKLPNRLFAVKGGAV